MSSASDLRAGSHSARWGNWVVGLRSHGQQWRAKVYRWPPKTSLSSRIEIAAQAGFQSADDAATWASDIMVRNGAMVFVLDAPSGFTLKAALDFKPAPDGAE